MFNIFTKMLHRREIGSQPTGVPESTNRNTTNVKTGAGSGSYDSRIVYADSPLTALSVSAVHRAIELRSKALGVMPVQYRRKSAEKGNFTPWMQGIGKRINYLLQEEPNPIMTAPSLWGQVTVNQLQLGNGFVYIERDVFGDPVHLWLAECGGYNYIEGTYNISYLSEVGVITKVNVPKQDVLHFPNTYRYQNGFWGIPTLKFAAAELSLIKTEKQQTLETAAKGGRLKLLIGEEKPAQVAGTLAFGLFDKPEMDNYAQEINTKIYKQDVVALRGLDKVQNISMSAQDMQMIEQLGLSYDDISRYYAVPRPLLMLDTNSHYNDYQNATMEFHTRTVMPDKTEREKEIARKLIGVKYYGVRDIHICERPLMAMDPERQAKVDEMDLRTGAKTVNEIRQEHDMPSVANGDIVYISTNLAELGSNKLSETNAGMSSNESSDGTAKSGEESSS